MVSLNWFTKFSATRVHHIDSTTSDHKMLWIDLSDLDFQPKKKVFKFKEMWLADKGCGETIEGVWQASYGGAENLKVIRKLENCGKELTRWIWDYFGNVQKVLEKK